MKDDAYIQHMIDAISQIEKYTKNMDYKDFEKDELRQDAVIRQMEVLGEAAKRVSEDTKNKYPEIPWQDAAGMRDKLIHGYFGVDTQIVWTTIRNDISQLKKEFHKIKENEI